METTAISQHYIAKFNPNGDVIWVQTFLQMQPSYDNSYSTVVDQRTGKVINVGSVDGGFTVDGRFTLTAVGRSTFYVVTFAADGTALWATSFPGGSQLLAVAFGVGVGAEGNSIVGGYFGADYMAVGTQTLAPVANWDPMLIKLDPSGTPVWGSASVAPLHTPIS